MTYPAGIAAKRVSGKPLVVHVHATEFDRTAAQGNPDILGIEKEGMKQADQVIAVSHLTKRVIVNHYKISPDKVKVVHNGVQRRQGKPLDAGPLMGKRVITFLGRITHQKGPEYFIDAAALVHKKFPDVHFVMAGSGDLLPKMIRKVASLNLSSHIHFTGFLTSNKVDQIWAMSDMYVMPSVSEPFGITPLEAMMAGVPVIISNQSGVAEVVNHAIKVNFWDIKALANAMMGLLNYKSLSNTVKQNGTVEIQDINWNTAAKKIKSIYHETLIKKQ
jgi:glycosyltransferase involved in cell wall biosynthesis